MIKKYSKVDLHVHTRYSGHLSDWRLKMLGAKECYTSPEQVYSMAVKRGMDFVTISDHDTINGALQLAHLPNFFISEEVTTFFPEDGAKIHVVVLNIDEEDHRMIQTFRSNIYDLVLYLNNNDIHHFIAHPLYSGNATLTVEHFEKMLLLFKTFEVKNGGNQSHLYGLLKRIFRQLSPSHIWQIADKYKIEPMGEDPWIKNQVGGSDDHGGLLIGYPHTQTPAAISVDQLLDHIKRGRSKAVGPVGSPLCFTHGVFSVMYHAVKENKKNYDPLKSKIVYNLMDQIFDHHNGKASLSWKIKFFLHLNSQFSISGFLKKRKHPFIIQVLDLLKNDKEFRNNFFKGFDFNPELNRIFFKKFSSLFNNSLKEIWTETGNTEDFLTKIKKTTPLLSSIVPYLWGFHIEYSDRPLIRKLESLIVPTRNYNEGERIALMCDYSCQNILDYDYLNSILNNPEHFSLFGLSDESIKKRHQENFQPVFEKIIDKQRIKMPPLLTIAEKMSRQNFNKIYLHTMGLMGLTGLFLSKLLKLPVVCRYPEKEINDWIVKSDNMETAKIAHTVFSYIFSQAEEIYIPSAQYRLQAETLGFLSRKMVVVEERENELPELQMN